MPKNKKRLVVIGNGMAGSRFVAELCARGGADKYRIVMFGAEKGGAYNRILLSDVLNGSKSAQSIETHAVDWYAAMGVFLCDGKRVASIKPHTKELTTEDGDVLFYDVLVFATGSQPAIPPMDGLLDANGERKKGIFVMRTLEDCDRIAAYATKARQAAVIGGGLLGLEAARGLMQHGAGVHLIHRSDTLMSAQLDRTASDLLQTQIESMGINVLLEKSTTNVLGEESVTGLEFRDGSSLDCDMVVIATGVKPNVELARKAGLPVEIAILVDDSLHVGNGIYAIGECCQHRGETYGLVAPAWDQARVLAQVLSGQNEDAAYEGTKTSTKLKVMGVELASIGTPNEQEGDEVIEYREARRGRYKKLVIREGKLVGAILLGDAKKSAHLMQLFERESPLPEERSGLIFDIGKGSSSDAKSLPDDATVCNCNCVSAGKIRACILDGGDSLSLVMEKTRAGTGCGTCKSSIREMLS